MHFLPLFLTSPPVNVLQSQIYLTHFHWVQDIKSYRKFPTKLDTLYNYLFCPCFQIEELALLSHIKMQEESKKPSSTSGTSKRDTASLIRGQKTTSVASDGGSSISSAVPVGVVSRRHFFFPFLHTNKVVNEPSLFLLGEQHYHTLFIFCLKIKIK